MPEWMYHQTIIISIYSCSYRRRRRRHRIIRVGHMNMAKAKLHGIWFVS